MKNTKVGTVYRTDDLRIFKILDSNRDIKESRKQKIIESIDKNGYISNPIIVNEKYEVIDGQGRLEACKELGISIDYYVVENIGIEECRVLNMNMTNWSLMDYIKSYASEGNEEYINLYNLAKMGCGINTYLFANHLYGGTSSKENIQTGKARCSMDTYSNAKDALEYLMTVKPFTDTLDGRRNNLERAILFAYKDENCDLERLTYCISKYYSMLTNIETDTMAMDNLSQIYNRNLKGKPRLYLKEDYDRFTRG